MLAPSCRMPSGGTRVQLSHRQASSRTSLVSGAAAANVYVAKLSFVISILGEAPQNNIYILFPVKLSIYSVWTHGLLLYFMGYIRLLSFSCFRLSQVWPAGGLASWLLYPFSYAPIASKDKYLLALRHNMMLQAHLFHVPQSWNQPRLLLVTNGIQKARFRYEACLSLLRYHRFQKLVGFIFRFFPYLQLVFSDGEKPGCCYLPTRCLFAQCPDRPGRPARRLPSTLCSGSTFPCQVAFPRDRTSQIPGPANPARGRPPLASRRALHPVTRVLCCVDMPVSCVGSQCLLGIPHPLPLTSRTPMAGVCRVSSLVLN